MKKVLLAVCLLLIAVTASAFEGKIVKVVEPSPARMVPRCPHFAECGGCHYQHLDYASQLALKQRIVLQQLERIGKLVSPPVAPIVPAPAEWNYRNTVQFSLSDIGKMSYQKANSNSLVEIRECHLPLSRPCPVPLSSCSAVSARRSTAP